MPKAYVEIRSQKAKGGGRFKGPDTYVAVQVVPDGQERLKVLNHRIAKKRGIEIIRCGQGYSSHDGPLSALGTALGRAELLAQRINAPLLELAEECARVDEEEHGHQVPT